MENLDADAAVARLQRLALRKGWEQFIQRYEWDAWTTLTPRFGDDCSARKLDREFENGFIRRLAFSAKRTCGWMRVMELSSGGVLHIHALVAGTGGLSLPAIRRAWKLGHAHIERYDANRGGAYYLTKTLHLDDTSFDSYKSSRNLPPEHA